MDGKIGFWDWVKILLPLVCAAGFGLAPRAADFESDLQTLGSTRPDKEKIAAVLAHEPWRTDAVVSLAGIHLSSGDPAAAIDLLEKANDAGRLTPDGLKILTAAYNQTGQISRELDVDQKILAAGAGNPDLYLEVYRLQAELGQSEEGLQTLQTLLDRYPENAEGWYYSGLILFTEDSEQGLRNIERAASLDPDYEHSYEVLLKADYLAGQSRDAAYSTLERGRGLGAAGAWDLAGEMFKKTVELNPDYAEGWAYLGEARQQTGVGSGWDELQKAAELDGQSQAVKGLTALYYRRSGRYDQALALISQAATAEPDQAPWQVEWAVTLIEKRDLEGALGHFRQAAGLEPDDTEYLYLLANFCLNYSMEVRETGLPSAREGAAKHPGDPRWPDLLGRIFRELGDMDLAERSFLQASALDADFPAARLHLAQLYLDRGDFEQAYPLLKTAAGQEKDAPARAIALRLLKQYFDEVEPD